MAEGAYRGMSKETGSIGEVQLLLVGHGEIEECMGLLAGLFDQFRSNGRVGNVERAEITNGMEKSVKNTFPATRILQLGQIDNWDGGVGHDEGLVDLLLAGWKKFS